MTFVDGFYVGQQFQILRGDLMARLDTVNTALDNIDAATTVLAAQVAEILERVKADDISNEELTALAERASSLATSISEASTTLATVEPIAVPVPPMEEIPVEEPPVEEPPVEEPPVE